MENWPIIIVAIIIIITIEIVIFCTPVGRKAPANFILLIIFTICLAYLIGLICYFQEPLMVYCALLITTAGFVGMTIYAMVTDTDYTIYWALLFGVSFAFFIFGIILLFVYNKIAYLIFALIGVILGLVYVAFDT